MGVREEKFTRKWQRVHDQSFSGIKSNYVPTFRAKFPASTKAVVAEQVDTQVQDVEPRYEEGVTSTEKQLLHLQRPYLAKIPTYNYNPGELEPQDPRGIGAIMQSFHDEAATAREAVYTYYEQHKGQEITPALQKEYQKLFARAEKTAERLRIVREIASLVSSTSEIDANQVKQLFAEDARSAGGALKWLYGLRKDVNRQQFAMLGKLAVVLLLGGVGGSALTACTVATEPSYTPTTETTGEENENTQTAATDVAPTMLAPTEPAPTEPATLPAEPTATAEAEATLIPSDVMFGSDVPEDDNELRNEYYTYFQQSGIFTPGHPNALVTESSVKIHSDRLAELIGDPANYEGVGYGPGDYIVLDENHRYDNIYGQLVFDGENQIDLSADESYSLQFNEDGALIWASSDPAKETYYWVDWYSDGEFLTQHALVQAVEELQQEADLAEAQAYAAANGLGPVTSIEYDGSLGGKTTGYGPDGNPVVERENEDSEWLPAAPVREWLFGPNEKVNSFLEGKHEVPNTVIYYSMADGGWSVKTLSQVQGLNPYGFMTPDEFYQQTKGVINGYGSVAVLNPGIGINQVINEVWAAVPIGYQELDVARVSYHYEYIRYYTYAFDKEGNPILLVFSEGVTKEDENGESLYSSGNLYSESFDGSGNPLFRTSKDFPYGPLPDFIQEHGGKLVYLVGHKPATYIGDDTAPHRVFDGLSDGFGVSPNEIEDTWPAFAAPNEFKGLILLPTVN